MIDKEELELRAKLASKVLAMRDDVLKADWEDDKYYELSKDGTKGGRGGFGYLSADKVIKTLAPLWVKHKIIPIKRYEDLEFRGEIGYMSQNCTVKCILKLQDAETGYVDPEEYSADGQAGDSGDKAVTKDMTVALKNVYVKAFDIADGIDPDADDPNARGRYIKNKDDDECESKLRTASLIPPNKVPPTPVSVPAPVKAEQKTATAVKIAVPKPVAPKPDTGAETKTESPAGHKPVSVGNWLKNPDEDSTHTEVAKPVTESGKLSPSNPLPATLAKPQVETINGIVLLTTAKLQAGKINQVEFDKMMVARNAIVDGKTAVDFINEFRTR